MRVLVAGGAGFIGSHFVRRLAASGDEVVVLDKLTYAGNRSNLDGVEHEFHEGDIIDADAVAAAADGCEAIVNFAAESHVDRSILGPAEFIVTDVLGTQVLLDHARRHELRYVQVSTDEVYGAVPLDAPACAEDSPIRASSPYSASKAGGDLQVLAYVRTFGANASITRGANTYGSHQYPEKLLPLFVTNAFDGRALPVYGDGRQRREWLHVEDHCAAIDLVLREGRAGEIYNVSGLRRRGCLAAGAPGAGFALARGGGRAGEIKTASGGGRKKREVVGGTLPRPGAPPALADHARAPPGHDRRYAIDSSKLRAL